jgi:hypothetical protein
MELGPNPAADAADHGSRGLDGELSFAADHLGGEDWKPSRPSSLEADALRC